MAKSKGIKPSKRTVSLKWGFQKNVFHTNKKELIAWIKQSNVQVRCHNTGSFSDGTEFINVTIEGFKL